jgi:mono/diheme cytochrome c family protein
MRPEITAAIVAAGLVALTAFASPTKFAAAPRLVPRDTGARLFATNCAPCHQASGLGLAEQFPPLAESEWVTGSEARLIRVMLQGLTGEIEVQGEMFKGAMPGWGPLLDDFQIAAVATYIRSTWGNKSPAVLAATVTRVRRESAERRTPWSEAELRGIGGASPARRR